MKLYCGICGGLFVQFTGRPARNCPSCRSETAERYGRQHRKSREKWAELVEEGGVCLADVCLEESRVIEPGADWDLGHDDTGRERGPEHRKCNEVAGAREGGHAKQRTSPPAQPWKPTRAW
jgi:hypothetical protein